MYLFILENIGTQELLLIGIVALIFLGPRKMPEYAKKIGKLMADFRSTTSEFKETWQREVNFEEEAKAFRIDDDDPKSSVPVGSIIASSAADEVAPPEIKEIDSSRFSPEPLKAEPVSETSAPDHADVKPDFDHNDKRNWL